MFYKFSKWALKTYKTPFNLQKILPSLTPEPSYDLRRLSVSNYKAPKLQIHYQKMAPIVTVMALALAIPAAVKATRVQTWSGTSCNSGDHLIFTGHSVNCQQLGNSNFPFPPIVQRFLSTKFCRLNRRLMLCRQRKEFFSR